MTMELKELNDNDNGNDNSSQLFLVSAPRDPMVSSGTIISTSSATAEEMNLDPQSGALVNLMGPQSSSICFPAKFSK